MGQEDWLTVIQSLEHSLDFVETTGAADIHDFDVASVADWRRTGRPVREHFLSGGGTTLGRSLNMERARQSKIHGRWSLNKRKYGLITLHRPANVDDRRTFDGMIDAFETVQRELPLVFAMHPRTRQRAEQFGLLSRLESLPGLHLSPPMGYLEFLHLLADSAVVFTDSGGIQEEATILGVPCLTLRQNTERPVTITHGTNTIAGTTSASIMDAFSRVDEIRERAAITPPLWDGQAAQRIAKIIDSTFA